MNKLKKKKTLPTRNSQLILCHKKFDICQVWPWPKKENWNAWWHCAAPCFTQKKLGEKKFGGEIYFYFFILFYFFFEDSGWHETSKNAQKKSEVGKFFWRWKKILDEKKIWLKNNFEKKLKKFWKQKLPELPRNYISGVGEGSCHGWRTDQIDDITEWQVESLLASSRARLKNESKTHTHTHTHACVQENIVFPMSFFRVQARTPNCAIA